MKRNARARAGNVRETRFIRWNCVSLPFSSKIDLWFVFRETQLRKLARLLLDLHSNSRFFTLKKKKRKGKKYQVKYSELRPTLAIRQIVAFRKKKKKNRQTLESISFRANHWPTTVLF